MHTPAVFTKGAPMQLGFGLTRLPGLARERVSNVQESTLLAAWATSPSTMNKKYHTLLAFKTSIRLSGRLGEQFY